MAHGKKRILFFHFDLQGGGAEKVLINLLNHLDPEKYDITLQTIFGAGPNVKDIPSHVRFKYLFKHVFRGFNTIMKLFSPGLLHRLLIHDKYDIEVGYMENSPTRIVSGCPNKDTKKIVWVHVEIEHPQTFLAGYRNKKEFLSCYHKVDGIAFVAKTALESFEHHYPEITTPKMVVYNVNDYERIRRLAEEEIPFSLDKGVVNLCSVGRLCSQKRFDRLIRIVARLKKAGIATHLYILGEGGDRNSLEQLIEQLSLKNDVTLLGYDSNPYKYVSKMDLFVCSSIKEGYSTAVTEAVSLGVPVVTTECSGMREILQDGKFGVIVPNDEDALYDGLEGLLKKPEQIAAYRTAIQQSDAFSTDSLVAKYEELFDSL